MREIRLTGREMTILRALGFSEPVSGAEIQEFTRMEAEDVTDALNALISAGFAESIPYRESIDLAEMAATSFEVNPAYAHELKAVLLRR